MDWLRNYQDDHKAVLLLLEKFDGNLRYLKAGTETPNTFAEFQEFADVIRDVVIPHFKSEETGIYKDISESRSEGKEFARQMTREHDVLYPLFDQYFVAVETKDRDKLIEIGGILERVLRHHILKEEDEMPRLFEIREKTRD